MSDGPVNVTRSTVHGDVAGRDMISTINNEYVFSGKKGDYMKSLLHKFKTGSASSEQMQDFIEDLDYYNNKRVDDVVGLEAKLEAGNRKHFLWVAANFKDRFHKLMYKYQFSEAAQKILLHLLAEVESRFLTEVYPMICNNEPEEKINMIITERLVGPVKDELDENLLGITANHIHGMVYFLTGNCHIKWAK